MPGDHPVVAVGLMSSSDLLVLRTSLNQLRRVDETSCFGSLLQAIDDPEGERLHGREVQGMA